MRPNIVRNVICSGLLSAILSAPLYAATEHEFPLREQFPDVATISTEGLYNEYEALTIIDARTRFEYDTIHIDKAIRVPVSSKSFLALLEKRVPDQNARIAFYCNGFACSKSYRAVRKAVAYGYSNSVSFDAGIFSWANAYPGHTTLLGKPLAGPSALISKQQFEARQISYESFRKKAKETPAVVIDVRDAAQRRNSDGNKNELPDMPVLGRERYQRINLDLFKRKLSEGKFLDQQLLIFDATGKQIRWLQYSLQQNGYTNYHFLAGGIYAVNQRVHQ